MYQAFQISSINLGAKTQTPVRAFLLTPSYATERYGKYRRKLWNDMENMDEMWKNMENMEKRQVEMWNDMENMEDFCVSHNYTQRDILLLLLSPPPLLLLFDFDTIIELVTSCFLWRHRWMTLYAKPINRHLRGGLKSLKIGSLDM